MFRDYRRRSGGMNCTLVMLVSSATRTLLLRDTQNLFCWYTLSVWLHSFRRLACHQHMYTFTSNLDHPRHGSRNMVLSSVFSVLLHTVSSLLFSHTLYIALAENVYVQLSVLGSNVYIIHCIVTRLPTCTQVLARYSSRTTQLSLFQLFFAPTPSFFFLLLSNDMLLVIIFSLFSRHLSSLFPSSQATPQKQWNSYAKPTI